VVLLVIFLAVTAWYLMPVLLLFFTGVLLAVLLNMPAAWLAHHTPLPTHWALIVVLVLLVALIGLGVWWLAPRLIEQSATLADVLTDSINRLERYLEDYTWGYQILDAMRSSADSIDTVVNVQSLPRLFTAFSGVFGGLADFLVVLFLGIYMAAKPSLYLNGVVGLFPHKRRPRLYEVLDASGEVLRRWLLTRMVEMVVVGGLTGIGLWLLGVPLAPILGLIAGLLVFIPILGTYLAIIPAAVVALAQGPATLLYVLLIYIGAQFFQDYILAPTLESNIITIPPVLMLTSQLIFGLLGGLLGVAMAVPIAVVIMVWVKLLYVEDVLGDPVELPGET
jgi:predicted PurR-regulated permease PerM